jgi:hypothetical protein
LQHFSFTPWSDGATITAWRQESGFYTVQIRDKRFAKDVGNVVVGILKTRAAKTL